MSISALEASIFYASPHPYLIMSADDPDFSIIVVNQAYADVVQKSEKVLLGKSYLSFLSDLLDEASDKCLEFANLLRFIVQQKKNVQHHIAWPVGLDRLNAELFPILGDRAEVKYLVQTFQTSQLNKKIDQETKSPDLNPTTGIAGEYDERVYSILESIHDGFIAVDRNWNVIYWNKEAEHILSMKKDDMLGKNLWEVYHEAIPLKFYSEAQRAVSENIPVRFDEYFPPLKIWTEVSALPNENGLSIYFKDITFRKDAEALLNSEKERYLDLFNLSPIPQWVYDLETLSFLDVNNAAIEHYGYSRAEFLAMTLNDVRPESDKDVLKEIIQYKVKKGSFSSSIVRHRKKNGKVIFVKVEGNSISFQGKNARLALAIDITEKLKAERALEASERRFKALIQDGSDLIAILNDQGMYKYVSPTSSSILGVESLNLIGKSAFDFIHKEDAAVVLACFRSLETDRRVQLPPFRFNVGSGEYRWIDTIVTNMMDEPGVEGLVANSRDITERMMDKIRTEESIRRFETVSEATSDVIYDWNVETDMVTWNRGIKRVFGYDELENTFAWWLNQIYPGDAKAVAKHLESSIEKLEPKFEIEYRFRCADGTFKYVLDRGFIKYDNQGLPYRMTGSMEDITQRKAYIEKIEGQNRRLLDISQLQSHYVRAPLTQIMALVKVLTTEHSDSGDNESLFYLAQAAENLDAVIKSIIKNTEDS